jgi:hypothetical protein
MVSFRPRTRPLDWAAVGAARDVEAVARSQAAGVQDIQVLLNTVAFGDASTPPSPALLHKAFGYAQLTVEYLLHVQESLTASLEVAHADLASERERLDKTTAKLLRRQGQGRELRDAHTTLAAASTMLAQFGVDAAPLLQRASQHGGKRAAPMQVRAPRSRDFICTSSIFLKDEGARCSPRYVFRVDAIFAWPGVGAGIFRSIFGQELQER